MTDAGLALDTLLCGLLVGAIAVGWRLGRRLRSLTAAHAAFVGSIAELDSAALRAERALTGLRSAAAADAQALAERIATAEALASRLEQLTAGAELALARQRSPVQPVQALARPLRLARGPADDDLFEVGRKAG